MSEFIPAELLATLDVVVMEHLNDSFFRMIGTISSWFMHFYPDVASERDGLLPGKKFPFLENFLIDAENFWLGSEAGTLKSGIWSEVDLLGNECHLEASAVRLQNKRILLISLLGFAYEEKQYLIQTGRENSLNYHRVIKKIQEKEILLHCIVHDMAGQLMGLNYCFELISLENLSPKGRERLEIGRRISNKQEMLMREMLNAFSAEVESLETFTTVPTQAPDVLSCIKEVVNALSPTFSIKNMQLRLAQNIIDVAADWKVVGEKSRLERVLFNLMENSFRHSTPFSTVTVSVKEDGEFILIAVDDEGSGVSQEMSKNLFQKFSQGKEKSGRSGLGLYFCRITVESWGGTVGYSPRTAGGSQFWFRLPRPVLR